MYGLNIQQPSAIEIDALNLKWKRQLILGASSAYGICRFQKCLEMLALQLMSTQFEKLHTQQKQKRSTTNIIPTMQRKNPKSLLKLSHNRLQYLPSL